MTSFLACYNTNMGIQSFPADFSMVLEDCNIFDFASYISNMQNDKASYLKANIEVQAIVGNYLEEDDKLVCFTEDHSLVSGIFSNLPKNSGLVYIDAHTDIHNWNTSTSKKPHGMSLGSLMGLDVDELKGHINPENLIIIGAKDIDEEEYKNLTKLGIGKVFAYNKDKQLFVNIFSKDERTLDDIINLIKDIINRTDAVGLSLDLDAIDTKDFNSAHYKTGNLPAAMCLDILKQTSKSYNIIEITELSTQEIYQEDKAQSLSLFQNIVKEVI